MARGTEEGDAMSDLQDLCETVEKIDRAAKRLKDKRDYFLRPSTTLTPAQEQENETLVNTLAKERGLPYAPPKVKLVKLDTTTFHPCPCTCHPNRVTKETL